MQQCWLLGCHESPQPSQLSHFFQSIAESINILVDKANGPRSLLWWGITMNLENFFGDLNTINFTNFLLFCFIFTRQKEPRGLKSSGLIQSPLVLRVLGSNIQSSMEPLCTMSQDLENCVMLHDVHLFSCPDFGTVAIYINQINFTSIIFTFSEFTCGWSVVLTMQSIPPGPILTPIIFMAVAPSTWCCMLCSSCGWWGVAGANYLLLVVPVSSSLSLEALECNPLSLKLESSLDDEDDELIWDAESMVSLVKSTIPTAELAFLCTALGRFPAEASGPLTFQGPSWWSWIVLRNPDSLRLNKASGAVYLFWVREFCKSKPYSSLNQANPSNTLLFLHERLPPQLLELSYLGPTCIGTSWPALLPHRNSWVDYWQNHQGAFAPSAGSTEMLGGFCSSCQPIVLPWKCLGW